MAAFVGRIRGKLVGMRAWVQDLEDAPYNALRMTPLFGVFPREPQPCWVSPKASAGTHLSFPIRL